MQHHHILNGVKAFTHMKHCISASVIHFIKYFSLVQVCFLGRHRINLLQILDCHELLHIAYFFYICFPWQWRDNLHYNPTCKRLQRTCNWYCKTDSSSILNRNWYHMILCHPLSNTKPSYSLPNLPVNFTEAARSC